MTTVKYNIIFHSPWHCGSGLSAGADLDALVIKDKDGLPYIPGKTLKGLIREAVEDYVSLLGIDEKDDLIEAAFGRKNVADSKDVSLGNAFFTNAVLSSSEKSEILKYQLHQHLYLTKASTRIDDDGIAEDHTLRRIEMVVPCTLCGEIIDLDDKLRDTVVKSLGLIKRLGVNRNRDLGRCTFVVQ